jgi:hypothetical protein
MHTKQIKSHVLAETAFVRTEIDTHLTATWSQNIEQNL